MLTLGLVGGRDRANERYFEWAPGMAHDSAAVLVRDGEVIAAIEQERIDRIKHSSKFAGGAVRACLELGGVTLADVDAVAYAWSESAADAELLEGFLRRPRPRPYQSAREFLRRELSRDFDVDLDDKIHFVEHHVAHAYSAFAHSGFEQSLVLVTDAMGDTGSGLVGVSRANRFELTRRLTRDQSLGFFYVSAIGVIGYKLFDEYKVMGLAPYGDASRYRAFFGELYRLLPDGDYLIRPLHEVPGTHRVVRELERVKGAPIEQRHRDFAASLQEALEQIVFHVVKHHHARSGLAHLAIAGGVALNCTVNGKLLLSGMFKDIFVQPAAHDAGAALGAALWCSQRGDAKQPARRLKSVSWGRELGDSASVERRLSGWRQVIEYERPADICAATAELLAAGHVVGWAQGRSEFGPRALGQRSILADPRPAANKDRINAMVKKREGYRPFAPSVHEEQAERYFEIPAGFKTPFMLFVVPVRPEWRAELGAITHVDGTARVQTVSRADSPRYWELIQRFGALTGVPMLLNTSFNNNAEPIVDSVDEALTCFLTTGLDFLVVDDFLVRRKAEAARKYDDFVVSLPDHVRLRATKAPAGVAYTLESSLADGQVWPLEPTTGKALMDATLPVTLGKLETGGAQPAIRAEVMKLWTARAVTLSPPSE